MMICSVTMILGNPFLRSNVFRQPLLVPLWWHPVHLNRPPAFCTFALGDYYNRLSFVWREALKDDEYWQSLSSWYWSMAFDSAETDCLLAMLENGGGFASQFLPKIRCGGWNGWWQCWWTWDCLDEVQDHRVVVLFWYWIRCGLALDC